MQHSRSVSLAPSGEGMEETADLQAHHQQHHQPQQSQQQQQQRQSARFQHSSISNSSASSSSASSSASSSSSNSAQVIDSALSLNDDLLPAVQFRANSAGDCGGPIASHMGAPPLEAGAAPESVTPAELEQLQEAPVAAATFIVTTQPPSYIEAPVAQLLEMSLGAAADEDAAGVCELRAAADEAADLLPGPGEFAAPLVHEAPPELCARLERSNSCSEGGGQAEGELLVRLASSFAGAGAGGPISAGPAAMSVSHDNLAAAASAAAASGATSARFVDANAAAAAALLLQQSTGSLAAAANEAQEYISSVTNVSALSDSAAIGGAQASGATNTSGASKQQQAQAAQKSQSSSSRFFSSKLNTGSLWSLLSVGSATSTSALNEMPSPTGATKQPDESGAAAAAAVATNASTTMMSNFFTRQLQFAKRPSSQTSASASFDQQPSHKATAPASSSATPAISSAALQEASNARRPKYRFQVKYVGSAMLHKNFTLPMLEWVVKDIRRQTNRSLNQRQFTIPIRDIVLEIHAQQLVAIACKDGHCIFVHPMHCVSKYAQLQHDPTCFSYIIRDHKEAPSFCHSFQAKSVAKVHEIFNAIRETTTRNQLAVLPAEQQASLMAANRLQKSASTDGHWRSLLAPAPPLSGLSASATANAAANAAAHAAPAEPPSRTAPIKQQQPSFQLPQQQQQQRQQQQQQQQKQTFPSIHAQIQHHQTLDGNVGSITNSTSAAAAAAAALSCAQFENSYQFEVMFVKRVKLQCRRVPPSFVDDALETLKTFEAPKQTQIKGVTKRIISASVDERQEYDESCQSPTPGGQPGSSNLAASKQAAHQQEQQAEQEQRRGSSVSLRQPAGCAPAEGRESKSCHQSPAKSISQDGGGGGGCESKASGAASEQERQQPKSHHQSVDCLKSLADFTIRRTGDQTAPPAYFNDFSPYNTITSSDLNERIAAIPVVSSSVSLDHETRQRLARQVRETIMATAATIKKEGAFAASDGRLDVPTTSSSKVLDALSCNAQPQLEALEAGREALSDRLVAQDARHETNNDSEQNDARKLQIGEQRRKSAAGSGRAAAAQQAAVVGVGNNFDLFRRASARQVVKNRTMLLLIGKDELCAISIDKHQMLFSKSFNSIVHCLQGMSNKDHFGLICRDSGKINPQAESFAGYVFKCQADKVVREIMGALKQVIYSSQHNYHGLNSPYNPLNYAHLALVATPAVAIKRQQASSGPKNAEAQLLAPGDHQVTQSTTTTTTTAQQEASAAKQPQPQVSLAAKRGFVKPIEINEAAKQQLGVEQATAWRVRNAPPPPLPAPPTAPALAFAQMGPLAAGQHSQQQQQAQVKNPIKSMFCDDCPLYWFHRLCCDVESLPAEASKAIILRRIDASLTEREQDDVYSKFSEFNIESIDEHNEIFMSLLRQLAERKQLKHNQSQAHASAMAKSLSLARQQSSELLRQQQHQQQHQVVQVAQGATAGNFARPSGHQRSGSSGGSLAQVIGAGGQAGANQTLADASSAAIDNLKRAKNSISVSIENLLKRRASLKDGEEVDELAQPSAHFFASRSGSFKGGTRELRATNSDLARRQAAGAPAASVPDSSGQLAGAELAEQSANLRRSQSTSDYSRASATASSWCDSLRRTLNDDLTSSLVGSFAKRRGSGEPGDQDQRHDSKRASNDSLAAQVASEQQQQQQQRHQSPARRAAHGEQQQPAATLSARWIAGNASPASSGGGSAGGGSGPSYLSGAFWKKSIFDKIHQPAAGGDKHEPVREKTASQAAAAAAAPAAETQTTGRTRAELRALWKKAILEQITLLKMDKQNQKLQANAIECNVQRMKLNYRDVPFGKDAGHLWDKLLRQDPTQKVQFVEVAKLVRLGVPKQRRGEVWMFLMNQYQLRHGTSFQPPPDSEFKGDADQTYRSLLSQLSTQQHEIFVDIGRTFPAHPYYSQYLSIGQLSLFNLLKAYSLLDKEVGYCQGLSFVAGILLLHVDSEDEAFELMRHLLFNFGLRKQYLPSMNALHLQLYQLTRLLRDHQYEIFQHFDRHDISPSLYAAPWFLTMFASQFPLGFVARLLDLIYLIGIEAIFRVSLTLLAFHRAALLQCASLEASMDFMRRDLVKVDDASMAKIFHDASTLDLRNKLIEYEIEYSFYCAEDKARSASSGFNSHHHHLHHHHSALASSRQSANSSSSTVYSDVRRADLAPGQEQQAVGETAPAPAVPEACKEEQAQGGESNKALDITSEQVADATATVIIQHLLANNHLRTLRSNYSY